MNSAKCVVICDDYYLCQTVELARAADCSDLDPVGEKSSPPTLSLALLTDQSVEESILLDGAKEAVPRSA